MAKQLRMRHQRATASSPLNRLINFYCKVAVEQISARSKLLNHKLLIKRFYLPDKSGSGSGGSVGRSMHWLVEHSYTRHGEVIIKLVKPHVVVVIFVVRQDGLAN